MPTIGFPQIAAFILAVGLLFTGRKFLEAAGVPLPSALGGGGDPRGRNGDGGGRGEMAGAKWTGLLLWFGAGVAFAFAFIGLTRWAIQWGQANTAGYLAAFLSVAIVAVGWWALDGVVGLVKDLADGVPDKEAHTAALLVPTTWPVGMSSLWTLFTNPQGFPTGLAGVMLSIVGIFFIARIVRKSYNRSKGTRLWNWATAIMCLLAGIMHIPAFIYGNQFLNYLSFGLHLGPININSGDVPNAIRLGIGVVALGLVGGAAGDILKGRQEKNRKKWSPGLPTYFALQFAIPILAVTGAVVFNNFDSVIFSQAK